MKTLIAAVVLSLVTVACGAKPSDNNSDLNARGNSKNALGDEVASAQGYIASITHLQGRASPTSPGFTKTFVSLEIPHGCFDKFATASHNVSYDQSKATIDVSAFNYVNLKSRAAMCTQELKAEKKVIELNGFFTENTIKVNWLTGPSVSLKKGDLGVYAINKVMVVSAREICPQVEGQMSCRAVGSTIELSLALNGCVDRLANVATKFDVLDGDKVRLTISALGMSDEASRRTRCIVAPTAKHSISTGYNVKNAAALEVVVLK